MIGGLRPIACAVLAARWCFPGTASAQAPERSAALYGYVRQESTGEPIASALVRVDGRGAWSDRDGYFTFPRLTPGAHRLRVLAIGYATVDTAVIAGPETGPIEVLLTPVPIELEGILVDGRRTGEPRFALPAVSVDVVTVEQVRRVPAAVETDLFRSLQARPGVIGPGMLSSRLLVRGGAADQNQFLLDGFPVLYPHHLAGAFSVFHLEAVRRADFWFGAPPARYGGKLSSVLNVSLREGNREEVDGAAALGLVSSSAIVEGPHPGGAWFVGARRTYLDLVTRAAEEPIRYHFYDVYGKTYADLSPADRLSALVFLSRDRFDQEAERQDGPFEEPPTLFQSTNVVLGAAWRRLFGGRAIFEQRASLSLFDQALNDGYSERQRSRIATDHRVELVALRGELRWDAGERHELELGYAADWTSESHRTAYRYPPMSGVDSLFTPERSGAADAVALAVYAQHDWVVTDAVRLRFGLRGERSGRFRSVQPRFAFKYLWSDRLALSGSAGWVQQYGHLLQDPDVDVASVYDIDIWLSAHEPGVPMARAFHATAGAEALLPWGLRARLEGYLKEFGGLLSIAPFDESYRLPAVARLERVSGIARGIDLSIERDRTGPVRGWIGYSLAMSRRSAAGAEFPAAPHPRQRVVAVVDARRGERWHVGGRFEAIEGVPYTPAVAMVPNRYFDLGYRRFSPLCEGTEVSYLYGERNSARTSWSKRVDLGARYRRTDRRGWVWEVSLSLLNALFDPLGPFRPERDDARAGCTAPTRVIREGELVLPPIPSISVRIEF